MSTATLNAPMLFAIDHDDMPEEKSAARAGNAAAYAARLAAVLGNGAEWEYRGECWERQRADGKCACGHHGLRFEFRIHHATRGSVIVGSSCINSYHGISPEHAARLQADMERFEAAARERERLAREAARNLEVQKLMAEWSALEWQIDEAAQNWRNANQWRNWEPTAIYRRGAYSTRLEERRDNPGMMHRFCRLPALKTSAGQIKRIRSYIDMQRRTLDAVKAAR